MGALGGIILKLALAFLLIVVNAVLLQYVSTKQNMEYKGFDNSTSIALIIGIVFLIVSFLPRWKLPIAVVGCTALPVILIKEFYQVDFKKTLRLWAHWVGLYAVVVAGLSLVAALFV